MWIFLLLNNVNLFAFQLTLLFKNLYINNMNTADRLRKLLLRLKLTNKKFAIEVQESPKTTSNWATRGFGLDVGKKIITRFPDVNLNWLLDGRGQMFYSDSSNSNITQIEEGNYMMVEYVDLRASAGRLGIGDVGSLPERNTRLVPREFENGNFLIIRVDGDSMDDGTKRSLSDGDEILIKERIEYRIEELPIKKALFVITTRDGNVLKQIAKVDTEKECILCRSFNSNYSDYEIPFEDIFQIFIVCKVTNRQITF